MPFEYIGVQSLGTTATRITGRARPLSNMRIGMVKPDTLARLENRVPGLLICGSNNGLDSLWMGG